MGVWCWISYFWFGIMDVGGCMLEFGFWNSGFGFYIMECGLWIVDFVFWMLVVICLNVGGRILN